MRPPYIHSGKVIKPFLNQNTNQDDTDYQWLVIPDMTTAMECPDVVSPVTTILAASVHYSVYKGLFYNTVIFHLHHWRKHKHAKWNDTNI